eukprot:7729175-Heterocapsa_arctica.AAC.1
MLEQKEYNNNKGIGMIKQIQDNVDRQNARKQEEEEGKYRQHKKLKMQDESDVQDKLETLNHMKVKSQQKYKKE